MTSGYGPTKTQNLCSTDAAVVQNAKEFFIKTFRKLRQVPGKGSMPWNEIGLALRDIDYQGAVVMEPFVMQSDLRLRFGAI